MEKFLRVYADTSVFGGACDREFEPFSVLFFGRVRAGAVELFVSSVTLDELEGVPEKARDFFEGISSFVQRLEVGEDAYALRQAYLRACVVSPKWAADEYHVASATVSGCTLILSWNFKHIVNYRRVPLYNAVNVLAGYTPITICSPLEVVSDEEEDI